MRTGTSHAVASVAFSCDVCGATLDADHLDRGRDGSHCAFCGAPQARSEPTSLHGASVSLDIGDTLHDARLNRGETLEQASHFTRIQPAYLRALEHDDTSQFEPFPGMAYARYFLRDYAEHLGIDPRPLVRRFDGEVATPLVERLEREPVFRGAPHPRRWALGALLVLIALLIGSAAWVSRAADQRTGISSSPASGSARYLATGPIGPRGVVNLSHPAAHHIWISMRTTDGPSWVRASVDGNVVTEETVPPGEVRRWRADRIVSVRLGNAAAVILTVNGRRVATGPNSTVVDVSFALRGGAVVRL